MQDGWVWHPSTHKQPITYERVSAYGEKVPWGDIVKGYEISRGKFVVVDDEDFASAAVTMSRVLEMTDFVPSESIDPRGLWTWRAACRRTWRRAPVESAAW